MEIPRGKGVLRAKCLEAMYEDKPEFPGGRGDAKQKPSVGGVWIFSGTAHYENTTACAVCMSVKETARDEFRVFW